MRVLVAHNYYTLKGGEDVVFEEEASLLEQHGHVVIRLSKRSTEIASSGLSLAIDSIWNRKSVADIAEAIAVNQIDVVHFHNTFPIWSPAAFLAARRSGAIVVNTIHNFRMLCPKAVFYRDGKPCYECRDKVLKFPAIRHACYRESRSATTTAAAISATHRWMKTYRSGVDAFIAPSHYAKAQYEASGYPMSPIYVKPHFIEHDLGYAPGSGRYAMFVGRLSEEKGVRTLLEAAKQVPHIPLKIAGSGPLENLLTSLPEHIHWLGNQPSKEVYRLMGEAACLIVPSDCGETFGRVIVEAFSRGTPVICSAHGGQAEIVKAHVGKQFIPGDANSLAQSMREFFSSDFDIESLRQAARREYLDHYTASTNYKRLLEIYTLAREHRNHATTDGHHNELG